MVVRCAKSDILSTKQTHLAVQNSLIDSVTFPTDTAVKHVGFPSNVSCMWCQFFNHTKSLFLLEEPDLKGHPADARFLVGARKHCELPELIGQVYNRNRG